MLGMYKKLIARATPVISRVLDRRLAAGKEDPRRIAERQGVPSQPRPLNDIVWIHAASVGEAQSALILIDHLASMTSATFLMTTGTRTSADLMSRRLPPQAIHQYLPADHPAWVSRFLDHWRPKLVLWMESELWPNMLMEIQSRQIPALLVNARLSNKSYRYWRCLGSSARTILNTFKIILAQTDIDAKRFKKLGSRHVVVTDNLKYSAAPLPVNEQDILITSLNRPLWVYASTHQGEESLACRIHARLKKHIPNLLTIIIPRHPERRDHVSAEILSYNLTFTQRGDNHALPRPGDDIYLVDTLGELGLFYRISPIAMIGRSFSDDGGGGHNPIEAAQLNCAVLTGPHVKFQQEIFNDMLAVHACEQVTSENDLFNTLLSLLTDDHERQKLQDAARRFAENKSGVIHRVMAEIKPFILEHGANDAV
ncbi:MAG: 3-deoxy-D-manno-octulosonic acid transferase [Alphaproteobacteria bacterium]|nr:3-deoxy-D-manno-octulosonic acid transferase [Alphaproteobacteria bacterium]